jgi:hypothetical protein
VRELVQVDTEMLGAMVKLGAVLLPQCAAVFITLCTVCCITATVCCCVHNTVHCVLYYCHSVLLCS